MGNNKLNILLILVLIALLAGAGAVFTAINPPPKKHHHHGEEEEKPKAEKQVPGVPDLPNPAEVKVKPHFTVKVQAFLPVTSGCQQQAVAGILEARKRFKPRVEVDLIDIESTEGKSKWMATGLGCATVVVDHYSSFMFPGSKVAIPLKGSAGAEAMSQKNIVRVIKARVDSLLARTCDALVEAEGLKQMFPLSPTQAGTLYYKLDQVYKNTKEYETYNPKTEAILKEIEDLLATPQAVVVERYLTNATRPLSDTNALELHWNLHGSVARARRYLGQASGLVTPM